MDGASDPATQHAWVILPGAWQREETSFRVTLGKQKGEITIAENGNQMSLEADGATIDFDRED